MSLKTIHQERADFALQKINEVNNRQKEYGSLARGLPAMLQVNGLGNTLAFLLAKAEGKSANDSYHARMYAHLAGWLHEKVRLMIEQDTSESLDQFVEWLMGKDSSIYRMAATEAMEYAIWLRRFAEAKGWSTESSEGG